MNYIIL